MAVAVDPVERVIATIHTRFAEPLTVAGLARTAGVSRSLLANMFRRATGQSVASYVRDFRLAVAKRMILDGEKIEAVALCVGYRSKKSLYRQFWSVEGRPPGAFRNDSREGRSVSPSHRDN